MACFHPNHIVSRIVDGKYIDVRFRGGAGFLRSEDLYYKNPAEFHTLIPCGHCMGCRLDRARVWADRMLLELADNNYNAIFVTLTYDNEHVPYTQPLKPGLYYVPEAGVQYFDSEELWVPESYGAFKGSQTLCVRDVQLFFKRLRKAFKGKRIRYFLSGEYGPKTNRPHYHAIIFGLSLSDFEDSRILKYNDLGQPLYKSKRFASIWGNGHCSLSSVNWNTCSYVARYTMKKLYKSDDPEAYSDGRVPPFCTMSRKPGIGLSRAAELLAKSDKTFVRDENGVHEVYLGRSFVRSAARCHLNDLAALPAGSKSEEIRKVRDPLCRYHDLLKKRAFNSFSRSKFQLEISGKNVMDYYHGKEKYFLDRLKLLPERRDFLEKKTPCKSSYG